VRVGLIGLGRMGAAIAYRLQEQDVKVTAFDTDRRKCKAISSKHVQTVKTPALVAEASDIVISIVTDDHAVRSVFSEMLQGQVAKKLFIEMSTIEPATIRYLAPLVEQRGAALIDSPVLGSVAAAREGKLVALVGGRKAHVERSATILELLTRKVFHAGASGSGSAVKLAVNLTMAAYLQALAEALAITQRHDVSLDTILSVLLEAPTANGWLKGKLSVLKGEDPDITLDIKTLRKDVMYAVATAARAGIPMPAGSGILTSLSAAVARGWGPCDLAELPLFFREFMLQGETPETGRRPDQACLSGRRRKLPALENERARGSHGDHRGKRRAPIHDR
jgi:3-hydroxyisobutyrate dehydrogenase